jgi:hypothetical protein
LACEAVSAGQCYRAGQVPSAQERSRSRGQFQGILRPSGANGQQTGPVPAHTRTLRRRCSGACRCQRVSCFVSRRVLCYSRRRALEQTTTTAAWARHGIHGVCAAVSLARRRRSSSSLCRSWWAACQTDLTCRRPGSAACSASLPSGGALRYSKNDAPA